MKKTIFFLVLVLCIAGFVFVVARFVQNNEDEFGSKNLPDVVIESPKIKSRVQSPIMIRGKARGNWFFEGSFPVVLQDSHGTVIANSFVRAQGEWMTEQYVPFSGELLFSGTKSGDSGLLVFKKDNPSGLPEHDASTSIPVVF